MSQLVKSKGKWTNRTRA